MTKLAHQCISMSSIVKISIFCFLFAIFMFGNTAEGKKKSPRRQRRLTEVHQRNRVVLSNRDRDGVSEEFLPISKRLRNKSKSYRNRNRFQSVKKQNRRRKYWTNVIKDTDLSLPGLYQFLEPDFYKGKRLEDLASPMDTGRVIQIVRTQRLYCRAGIGFHLEIKKDGTITANHHPSPEGVLEIFSVKASIVGIRSAQTNLYLCMGKNGKLFTRKKFLPDCEFKEEVEKNNYNTYASLQYSNHKTRKGFFLAISRHGKIPRRMKRVSWKQKRAHWLPRKV